MTYPMLDNALKGDSEKCQQTINATFPYSKVQ